MRVPFLISLLVVASITTVLSIVDEDQDGMSDIWETLYNLPTDDGASPAQGNGPGDDPDFDGYSNIEESAAGTDPFDFSVHGDTPSQAPGTFSSIQLNAWDSSNLTNDLALEWWGVLGKEYAVENSPDLINWTADTLYTGADSIIQHATGLGQAGGGSAQAMMSSGSGGIESIQTASQISAQEAAAIQAGQELHQAKLQPIMTLFVDVFTDRGHSEVHWRSDDGRDVRVFSNINFRHLGHFIEIETSAAIYPFLIVASATTLKSVTEWNGFVTQQGLSSDYLHPLPARKDMPKKKDGAAYVTGYAQPYDPADEPAYSALDALHDYYEDNRVSLQSSWDALEAAQIAAAAIQVEPLVSSEIGTGGGGIMAMSSGTGNFGPDHFWRVRVADQNSDTDILSDWEEDQVHSDPQNSDTDSDGLTDGFEYIHGLFFVDYEFDWDSDGDGVSDATELHMGANPNDGSDLGVPPEGGFSLYVSGNNPEDTPKVGQKQVTIPQGTNWLAVVTITSDEYPEYTGDSSQWNDTVAWKVTIGGSAVIGGARNVNSLHLDFASNQGVSKLVAGVVKNSSQNDIVAELQVTITNIGDDKYPTAAKIKLLPLDFETFANDETREIGGDRSPNWKAHKLNMDTRQEEVDHYGDYEKCVAHIWDGQPLNIAKYLVGYDQNKVFFEDPDILNWKIDGNVQDSYELNLGAQPQENRVTKFEIEVVAKEGGQVIDHLVLTVVRPDTLTSFEQWVSANQDLSWLAGLPAVYHSVVLASQGEAINPESSLLPCDYWKNNAPFSVLFDMTADTYYHPDAYHEIRSQEVTGGHGHQACYDDQGNLIRSGVSAGTADKAFYGNTSGPNSHVNLDAKPFVWAVQLDGTPAQGEDGIAPDYSMIDNPIMHEGSFIGEYLQLRPPIVNNKVELAPGNCP